MQQQWSQPKAYQEINYYGGKVLSRKSKYFKAVNDNGMEIKEWPVKEAKD